MNYQRPFQCDMSQKSCTKNINSQWLLILQSLLIAGCFSLATPTTPSTRPLDFHVKEELPPGTVVGSIREGANLASQYPPDVLSRLRFSFRHSADHYRHFVLDETTGIIRTARKLDREQLCSTNNHPRPNQGSSGGGPDILRA